MLSRLWREREREVPLVCRQASTMQPDVPVSVGCIYKSNTPRRRRRIEQMRKKRERGQTDLKKPRDGSLFFLARVLSLLLFFFFYCGAFTMNRNHQSSPLSQCGETGHVCVCVCPSVGLPACHTMDLQLGKC